eukprot:scaffold61562_cov60-Phaeocystis_antarctica.AAC.2
MLRRNGDESSLFFVRVGCEAGLAENSPATLGVLPASCLQTAASGRRPAPLSTASQPTAGRRLDATMSTADGGPAVLDLHDGGSGDHLVWR